MRIRTKNDDKSGFVSRGSNDALKFAVQLVLSQLSQGIGLAEAVQFAAKYHNVTCAAIEAGLSRRGVRIEVGEGKDRRLL